MDLKIGLILLVTRADALLPRPQVVPSVQRDNIMVLCYFDEASSG